jgi:hypothetical protein
MVAPQPIHTSENVNLLAKKSQSFFSDCVCVHGAEFSDGVQARAWRTHHVVRRYVTPMRRILERYPFKQAQRIVQFLLPVLEEFCGVALLPGV